MNHKNKNGNIGGKSKDGYRVMLLIVALFLLPFVSVAFGEITSLYTGDLYMFGLRDIRDFYLLWMVTFGVMAIMCLILFSRRKTAYREKLLVQQKAQYELDNEIQQDNYFAQGSGFLADGQEMIWIGGGAQTSCFSGRISRKVCKSGF
jgi:hypothetical protein